MYITLSLFYSYVPLCLLVVGNISEYKSYVPITVNSIARARKAQLEAMKGNSSEDDSVDDYHDHNVCIAGGFGLGLDTPIPEYCKPTSLFPYTNNVCCGVDHCLFIYY